MLWFLSPNMATRIVESVAYEVYSQHVENVLGKGTQLPAQAP